MLLLQNHFLGYFYNCKKERTEEEKEERKKERRKEIQQLSCWENISYVFREDDFKDSHE